MATSIVKLNGVTYTLSSDSTHYSVTKGTHSQNVISIEPSIDGIPVTVIESNAFSGGNWRYILIPSTITTIKSSAFYTCFELKSLVIPSSVTTIEDQAFLGCVKLTSLILMSTSKIAIPQGAFEGCNVLERVRYTNSSAFNDGELIGGKPLVKTTFKESVVIDNIVYKLDSSGYFYTAGTEGASVSVSGDIVIKGDVDGLPVTKIRDHGFYNRNRVTSVFFEGCITEIGYESFNGCSNLEFITLPDSLTILNPICFKHCVKITSINFGANLKVIPSTAFLGCGSLTYLNIPEGITRIEDWAFCECYNLKNVITPSTLVFIGDSAFDSCYNIETFLLKSTTAINQATNVFSAYKPKLKEVKFTSANVYTDGAEWNGKTLKFFTPPQEVKKDKMLFTINSEGTGYEVKADPDYVIEGKLVIPSNVNGFPVVEISTGSFVSAFDNNDKLTSVEIPLSMKDVSSGSFKEDINIESVCLPNSILSIGMHAFRNNSSLKHINFPKSLQYLASGSFYGCRSLTSINLPKAILGIDFWSFCGCSSIHSFNFDFPYLNINEIKQQVLSNCSSLKTVVIGEKVDSISTEAISSCPNLSTVIIKSKNIQIKDDSFKNDPLLTKIFYTNLDAVITNSRGEQYTTIPLVYLDWDGYSTLMLDSTANNFNLNNKSVIVKKKFTVK